MALAWGLLGSGCNWFGEHVILVGYPRLLEMSGASFYVYSQPLHSNPKCLDLCGVLQATAYFQKPWTANLRNTAQRTAGWLRESLITLLLGHWLVQTARPPCTASLWNL